MINNRTLKLEYRNERRVDLLLAVVLICKYQHSANYVNISFRNVQAASGLIKACNGSNYAVKYRTSFRRDGLVGVFQILWKMHPNFHRSLSLDQFSNKVDQKRTHQIVIFFNHQIWSGCLQNILFGLHLVLTNFLVNLQV